MKQNGVEINNMDDKKLLEWYMMGWKDEMFNFHRHYIESTYKKAYQMGRADYVVGDDISTIDLQTEEEILNRIKSIY